MTSSRNHLRVHSEHARTRPPEQFRKLLRSKGGRTLDGTETLRMNVHFYRVGRTTA